VEYGETLEGVLESLCWFDHCAFRVWNGMEWCVVSTSELLSVFILVFLELVSVQSHFI
jgi:hypothetical protein